jgi:peptidoglycan L-alanyl-D-glutamate endopeptidase CwlK
MPAFGKRSQEKLDECEEYLRIVAAEAIKHFDFSIYEGHRSLRRQQQLFMDGKSKIDGITTKGNHNHLPSRAFDGAPYPIDFDDEHKAKARFYMWAGVMFACEAMLKEQGRLPEGMRLRWGGDWDSDKSFEDQSFDDLPHWEVVLEG